MWIAATAAAAVYGWWTVTRPPFSHQATAAVIAGGLLAMVWGRRRRSDGRRDPVGAVWPWAVVASAAGLWQLAAYLQGPRDDHPTLSSLANAALGTTAARTVAFVLWLLGAWELARR